MRGSAFLEGSLGLEQGARRGDGLRGDVCVRWEAGSRVGSRRWRTRGWRELAPRFVAAVFLLCPRVVEGRGALGSPPGTGP